MTEKTRYIQGRSLTVELKKSIRIILPYFCQVHSRLERFREVFISNNNKKQRVNSKKYFGLFFDGYFYIAIDRPMNIIIAQKTVFSGCENIRWIAPLSGCLSSLAGS